MRITALSLTLLALIGASARGDINSDIESLSEAYGKIEDAIAKAPEADRPKLYDKLREQVSAMTFGLGYTPDGSDTIKTDRSNKILWDFVYSAFRSDQGHLERAIIHTKDKARAIAVMPDRARCLIALFPLDRSAADDTRYWGERLQMVQYLADAYRFIPDSLVDSVRPQMPRWTGEDRIPGLLVLAEHEDADAKAELERLHSKSARNMKSVFRLIVDSAKKRDEQKGASNKSVEPTPTR